MTRSRAELVDALRDARGSRVVLVGGDGTNFLRAHTQVTRSLDAELLANFGLTMSSYELLARLTHAPDGQLRMSKLAERALLSPARTSRVIDELEDRGLVLRRRCPEDSRVVHVAITGDGVEVLRAAQDLHHAGVRERFFAHLSDDDVARFADVFARLAEGDPDRPGSSPGLAPTA